MRYLLVVIIALIGGAAIAQDQRFLAADGALFTYEKNRHGAVLKSVDPGSEALIDRADISPQVMPGEVLYLGRSCDAFNERYGDGHWIATDGGFLVQFGGLQVTFPGQQIDVGVAAGRCRS